jgi:hypothetical protein
MSHAVQRRSVSLTGREQTPASSLKGLPGRYLELVCDPHPIDGHPVPVLRPISIHQVPALAYFRLRPLSMVDAWMTITQPFDLTLFGGAIAMGTVR